MRIVVDAMGSDAHPQPDVEGAVLAAREYGVEIVLVGKQEVLEPELAKHSTAGLPISIVHAGQIIETHSISAGLDYPGAGPAHAWLARTGRAHYEHAPDAAAMQALDHEATQLAASTEALQRRAEAQRLHDAWDAEVQRIYDIRLAPLPSQGELIGALNDVAGPDAIMLNAAGSMPGDLHKLWRATHPKNFHLEYGNSCMGYEIAGGLGAKMAAPARDVFVIVGDGSYLMLSSELVTSVQEGVKLIVVLWDNHGFKSIGSLSRSLGLDGFGTRFVRPQDGMLAGDAAGDAVEPLQIDFAMNARSLGCHVIECVTRADYVAALHAAKAADRTTVIVIKNDRLHGVPGYESWWDVAVPEVSELPSVQEVRVQYEKMRDCLLYTSPSPRDS